MDTSWVLDTVPEDTAMELLEKETADHEKTKSLLLEKDAQIEKLQKELAASKKTNAELLEIGFQLGELLKSEARHGENKAKEIEILKQEILKKEEKERETRREISGLNTRIFFFEYEKSKKKVEKSLEKQMEALEIHENQENMAPKS